MWFSLSATIVNSELYNDVEAFKEQVTTWSTSYLTTTQEHRHDISQNRLDISQCLSSAKLRSTDSVNPRAVLSQVHPRYLAHSYLHRWLQKSKSILKTYLGTISLKANACVSKKLYMV